MHRIAGGCPWASTRSRDVVDEPPIQPDTRERGPRGVAGSPDRLGRPAGHRLPGTRLPARRLPQARLRALDELLVRRALHVRRLQPDLLPARRARRDQAARRAERRRVGRRLHARDPADVGRGDRLGDPLLRRRRRRLGRHRRVPLRPRASPSRSPRSSRSRGGGWSGSRCWRRSRSPRARSPSSSCSSCSPRPASRAARREIDEAGDDRGLDLRGRARDLAALPRPRPLSVPRQRAGRRARLLRRSASPSPGGSNGLGSCTCSSSPTARSASSPTSIPSNLGGNVVRLRYAAVPIAVLDLSLRRWRPLPVAVAALALAARLEPLPARLQPLPQLQRPVGLGRLLAARDRLPPPLAEPELPGRGGRHRRPLGGRLHRPGRDPDRARLVPAGRLPPERGPLRPPHAGLVPEVAAEPERALRRADRRDARLQRQRRGDAPAERTLRLAGRLPLGAHHRLRRPLADADRHRARAPPGREADREHDHARRSSDPGATASTSATRPT